MGQKAAEPCTSAFVRQVCQLTHLALGSSEGYSGLLATPCLHKWLKKYGSSELQFPHFFSPVSPYVNNKNLHSSQTCSVCPIQACTSCCHCNATSQQTRILKLCGSRAATMQTFFVHAQGASVRILSCGGHEWLFQASP